MKDEVVEMVENFTLHIVIPEDRRAEGVVLGSIPVATVQIIDDDSEYCDEVAISRGHLVFVATDKCTHDEVILAAYCIYIPFPWNSLHLSLSFSLHKQLKTLLYRTTEQST